MTTRKRKPKPITDADAMIHAALRIDEDDLAANDEGRLSARQRRRLWLPHVPAIVIQGFLLVFLLLITVFMELFNAGSPRAMIVPVFVMLPFFSLYLIILGPKALALLRDIVRQRVEVVEGRIQQDIRGNGVFTSYRYKLRINGRTFNVNKRTFLAFRNNDPYRLYYTPRRRKIVGAEWMQSNPFVEPQTESAPARLHDTAGESGADDRAWLVDDTNQTRTHD